MKLPLFRRSTQDVAVEHAQEQTERVLVEGLRYLGQLCAKVADIIEAQRLERSGFEGQGRFLQRLDPVSNSSERSGASRSTAPSPDPDA